MRWYEVIFWVCLALFLILTGLVLVTNINVAWEGPIKGFAAIAAGVLALVKAFSK